MSQRAIPCIFMRGGTSRGPYFRMADLPTDGATRDRVLLAVMGSPDLRQIDGLGGADPLTSKVCMVSPSKRPGVDVDFLFAQVSVDRAIVDTSPSCGNMLAGIGPFAIERGMVAAGDGETTVSIYNINTESRIEAVVQTPGGTISYEGDTAIDGVPGTAAPIVLNFMDVVGSKTGALLPTGQAREMIDGVEASCVDVAMPMVMMRASDVGMSGYETRADTDGNEALMARLEAIRREAGRRMGLGDVADRVVPKIGVLAAPRGDGSISSRYFTPTRLHAAHAVTGAVCVACACQLTGSVADGLARVAGAPKERIRIEHPSGHLDVQLEVSGSGPDMQVIRAGVLRTARKIMAGDVFVPHDIWRD